MRAEAGRIPLLDDHLGRLKTAAAALNLSLPDDAGQQICRHLAELPDQGAYRVKAALFSDGLQLSHAPLSDLPSNQSVILSDTALPERDFLRRFKTTHRETLDQGWRQAEAQGAFDSLFSTARTNCLKAGAAAFLSVSAANGTPRLWSWTFWTASCGGKSCGSRSNISAQAAFLKAESAAPDSCRLTKSACATHCAACSPSA